MPCEPFASRFGKRAGRTVGSCVEASKFGAKSTVSRSMSRSSSVGDRAEPRLGVAVGGGRVAVDRAEVALAVHQQVTERPVLGHARHGLVDGRVAVRVVVLDHLADDAGALHVGAVREQPLVVHRVEDAAMNGLETVAHVGERAAHDHRHRVVEEGAPDLVLDVHRHRVGDARAIAAGGRLRLRQTSRFWTLSAFSSMNSRRGSTSSPISVVITTSASTASSILTWSSVRLCGCMVVSAS